MHASRWVLMALALCCPAWAIAEVERLLVSPLEAEGIEPTLAARVEAALAEELGRLQAIVPIAHVAGGCTPSASGCMERAIRATGAASGLRAVLRPAGESTLLVLVRTRPDGEEPERSAEPLPTDADLQRAVRERLVRLLEPASWIGALQVEAHPGSEIWLDGELQGTAPLPGPLEGLAPGQHLLRVGRNGQGEARAYVDVRFEQTTRVRVEPRSDEVLFVEEASGRAVPLRSPADEGADGLDLRIVRWGLVGAGGVALATSLLPAAQAASLHDEREGLRGAGGAFPVGARDRERTLRERHGRRKTAALVLAGTGTALLAGAALLFWLDDEPSDTQGLDVGVGAEGLALTGRF